MLKLIQYKDLNVSGNIFAAPLAGYTNYPTRMMFQKFGADITFTEMVSCRGIVHNDEKTLNLMYTDRKERSKAVQIFGDDKYIIKDAIDYIAEKTSYHMVNLNAGCPVKKILKSKKGGALLRDVDNLKSILEYIGDKVKIPYTLKIRSGWDSNSLNYEYVGKLAEDNNCKMIILHPRTVKQVFTGESDWLLIYDLKKKLNIPVIGNGDIISPEQAFTRFEQGEIDGIMIGRGSIGRPWIFQNIRDHLKKNKYKEPDLKKKIKIMMQHLKKMVKYYGVEKKSIILFRGQMLQYLKHFKYSSSIRKQVQQLESVKEIKKILYQYKLL